MVGGNVFVEAYFVKSPQMIVYEIQSFSCQLKHGKFLGSCSVKEMLDFKRNSELNPVKLSEIIRCA